MLQPWEGIEDGFKPTDEDHGFIYLMTIENPETKKPNYYIGCKQFWSTTKRPPLKGKKRKRKVVKEHKWRDYTSSSTSINEWIKQGVPVRREILRLVYSQWELNYVENLFIMNCHTAFRDDFLNGFAGFRQGAPPKALREKVKKGLVNFDIPARLQGL